MSERIVLDRAVVERFQKAAARLGGYNTNEDAYSEYREAGTALRAALDAQQAGFVLVPVEPTEAMLRAAARSLDQWRETEPGNPQRKADYLEKHAIRWRAMIAARPQGEQKPDAIADYTNPGFWKEDEPSPSPAPAQGQDVGIAMPATRESQLDPRNPNRLRLIPPKREATMPKGDGNAPERDAERVMPKTLSAGEHAGLIARLDAGICGDPCRVKNVESGCECAEAAAALREADAEMGRLRNVVATACIKCMGYEIDAKDMRERAETAERKRAEAEERTHYAEGVTDLAMKHRDHAERQRDEAVGLLWQARKTRATDYVEAEYRGWAPKVDALLAQIKGKGSSETPQK